MPKKAFLLTAGLGTRFQPHTQFIPKPAIPFFNLPQALYVATLLKEVGVKDFFYNSHHLPQKLEQHLEPYFKRKSFFEAQLLDSAGGVAQATHELKEEDHFWIGNGDSYFYPHDPNFLKKVAEFHFKEEALITLITMNKPLHIQRGVQVERHRFKARSQHKGALHYTGLALASRRFLELLRPEPCSLFADILEPISNKEKVMSFSARDKMTQYELGNEKDFIAALKAEAKVLINTKETSLVFRAHKAWQPEGLNEKLTWFLNTGVWGQRFAPKKEVDFLCLPEGCTGNFEKLKNCTLTSGLHFDGKTPIEDALLVDASQWTKPLA